ncbi:MAG TPA: SAF domain-containing protein [Gemmataceae bacterium]|nr:SAF domain-containing protein [Gemmataceae bacterium]
MVMVVVANRRLERGSFVREPRDSFLLSEREQDKVPAAALTSLEALKEQVMCRGLRPNEIVTSDHILRVCESDNGLLPAGQQAVGLSIRSKPNLLQQGMVVDIYLREKNAQTCSLVSSKIAISNVEDVTITVAMGSDDIRKIWELRENDGSLHLVKASASVQDVLPLERISSATVAIVDLKRAP